MDSRKKEKLADKEWLFVVIIYIISTTFRFFIGNYFKKIHVYGDELTYYQMAESFAHGLGFRINNAVFPYRILYSVLLAPAFLFRDRHVQMRVIQLINSALISSTLFPYAILIRKLLNKRKMRFFAYSFFLIYADLCYSMTFMSENIVLPLGTWTVCLTMLYVWDEHAPKSRIGDKPGKAFLLGVLLYLGYMTKSSGIVMMPMVLGMICADTLWICIKKKNISNVGRRLTDILIVLVVFMILKEAGNLTWMHLERLTEESAEETETGINIPVLIESGIYLFVTAVIGIGVLPALFPLIFFDKLSDANKKMYTMVILMVGIGMLAVAWENGLKVFDWDSLRPHFRYVIYIWLPALLCFLSLMEQDLAEESLKKTLLFAIPVLICAVIFRGTQDGSTVDQTINYYIIRFLADKIVVVRASLGIVAIIAVPMMIKYQKQTFVSFIVLFCCIQLVNNALVIKYHHQDYSLSEETYHQISSLEDRIREDSAHTYLLVADEKISTRNQRLADTFFNMENVYTIYYADYVASMRKRSMNPAVDRIQNVKGCVYKDLKQIDHILIPADTEYTWSDGMMTEVPGYENEFWKLYIPKDKTAFPELHK